MDDDSLDDLLVDKLALVPSSWSNLHGSMTASYRTMYSARGRR